MMGISAKLWPAISLTVGLLTVSCAPANQQATPPPPAPPAAQPSPVPSPPVAQQPNNPPPAAPPAAPPPANQPLFCEGRMTNGWAFRADFVPGGFTQIRWTRDGEQPQISTLTFSETNAQGERIYRGAFRAATNVTLVDLSRGNVRPGSEVSVGVDEWGWSRGQCRS